MASQTHDQATLNLKATQEDLQVMVNYAKVLLEENMALHKLLKTAIIPFEDDLETLSYLSGFSHEMPILKTISISKQDQRPKDSGLWGHQLSPRIAARMSFWPESINSADKDLEAVLKEKMELKEEVVCLMEEVEVMKLALRRAGSELNLLKTERDNREETNRGQRNDQEEETNGEEVIAVEIPTIITNEHSTHADKPPPFDQTSDKTPLMTKSSDLESTPSAAHLASPPQIRSASACIEAMPPETPPQATPYEVTPYEATPFEAMRFKSISSKKSTACSASYKKASIRHSSIDADNYITAVSVVDYRPQENQSGHMYILHVTWMDGNIYEVYRRYGEFFTFCNALKQLLEAEVSPRAHLPLPAMGSPGSSDRSVKAHLDSIATFCEVAALKMDSKVPKSPIVTDFFKAYPRDKILGWVSTRSTNPVLLQKNSTDPEPVAINDENAELSTPLSIANGGTSQEVPSTLLTATENYVADDNRKLNLSQGDIVTVIEKCEDGWWLVSKGDMVGWAPSTYLESKNTTQEKTLEEGLKRRSPVSEYIAERPYNAVFDDELSFTKDAALHIVEKFLNGWWLARYNGMVGLAPASHLVKKLGKKVPRKTCVTLRSNFGHTISGVTEPPPRRLLESNGDEMNIEEGQSCNREDGEDRDT